MTSPVKIHPGKTGRIPNSALPVLLCRDALPRNAPDKARTCCKVFQKNGWVGPGPT